MAPVSEVLLAMARFRSALSRASPAASGPWGKVARKALPCIREVGEWESEGEVPGEQFVVFFLISFMFDVFEVRLY